MGKLVDLTGNRFGRLVVTGRAENHVQPNGTFKTQWRCLCDCGNVVIAQGMNLKNGHIKSCGCYSRDNPSHRKHGMHGSRLYEVWKHIKQRCYDKGDKGYKNYGGRGIRICNEWANDFASFHDWAIANGYRDDLTIDRIDNDGDYCPENCRWVTTKVQDNNKRNNRNITYNGKTQTLAQWCEELKMEYGLVWNRLYVLGWDVNRAFETP